MCTVLLRFNPDSPWPVLLSAVRDEYLARPWQLLAPGDHVIVNQGVDVNDFAPLRAAATPDPKPGLSPAAAWGDWIGLLSGGDFTGAAVRPLLIRKEVDGLEYGSGSASLV